MNTLKCPYCGHALVTTDQACWNPECPGKGAPGPPRPINIVFDGPPGPEAGRFVEVETDDGASINAGEWIDRGDGLWALRITALPEGEKAL